MAALQPASDADERLDFGAAVASSVHDIKNSLGLLLYTVEGLIDECDGSSAASRAPLNELRYEARRVNHELVHLLSLFKLERGLVKINVGQVDLEDFLAEVRAYNGPMLELKGIALECGSPDCAEWFFDRDLVGGIINTVINNAFRYARARVRVRTDVEDGCLVFRVMDDGPGFPAAMLAHDPGDASAAGACGYTGLGLYFASLVADLHRNAGRSGAVSLGNLDAGGGCFTLSLP